MLSLLVLVPAGACAECRPHRGSSSSSSSRCSSGLGTSWLRAVLLTPVGYGSHFLFFLSWARKMIFEGIFDLTAAASDAAASDFFFSFLPFAFFE